jgi:tRNA A58 N-methylase Trm61
VNPKALRGPFLENEPVVFLDRKDREYLSRLDRSRPIAIRGGKFSIEDIIGHEEGSVVRSSVNEPFWFSPESSTAYSQLPRNAQVIYPKDLGPS